jgi:hypothetical protein
MPIEIKELHIRVSVNTPQSPQSMSTGSTVVEGNINSDHSKDAIVAECVEQVLQILQNRAER